MNIDPTHLNAQQLGALGAEAVDHLARRACGTLTSYRLLLGRCLLAMDRHRYHFDHGCCTSIHLRLRGSWVEGESGPSVSSCGHSTGGVAGAVGSGCARVDRLVQTARGSQGGQPRD